MKINIKQVGDIHFNKMFSNKNLLKLQNEISNKTDYVIFTGDIIDTVSVIKDLKQRNRLISFFENISKKTKVIIELGNHDTSRTDNNRKTWQKSNSANFWNIISKIENVYFLPNDKFYSDNYVYITGINPPLNYYGIKSFDKGKNTIIKVLEKNRKYLCNLKNKNNRLNIFISHSPVHMTDKEVLNYLKEFDLILSGHMHNGLVLPFMEKIFPKNRGIISPLRTFYPDNARGIKVMNHNNKKIKLIITGGVTKIATSHGLFQVLNKLYSMAIEEINYDSESKKVDVNTLYL